MTRRVVIRDWVLEVDDQATAALQAATPTAAEACSCAACQNFVARCADLPGDLRDVLTALGLDVARPQEVYEVFEVSPGVHLYGGWYSLAGSLIAGQDCADRQGRDKLTPLSEDVRIGFTQKDAAPGRVNLEFLVHLPWHYEE